MYADIHGVSMISPVLSKALERERELEGLRIQGSERAVLTKVSCFSKLSAMIRAIPVDGQIWRERARKNQGPQSRSLRFATQGKNEDS